MWQMVHCPARSLFTRPNPVLENTAEETENPDPANALTRDPINVINGNVTLTERDLFIPAPGLPLAFERYYHSHGAAGQWFCHRWWLAA
jgi:hypothetical protein